MVEKPDFSKMTADEIARYMRANLGVWVSVPLDDDNFGLRLDGSISEDEFTMYAEIFTILAKRVAERNAKHG